MHKLYSDSIVFIGSRAISERTFYCLWQQNVPNVSPLKLMSDLCWTWQKDSAFFGKGLKERLQKTTKTTFILEQQGPGVLQSFSWEWWLQTAGTWEQGTRLCYCPHVWLEFLPVPTSFSESVHQSSHTVRASQTVRNLPLWYQKDFATRGKCTSSMRFGNLWQKVIEVLYALNKVTTDENNNVVLAEVLTPASPNTCGVGRQKIP